MRHRTVSPPFAILATFLCGFLASACAPRVHLATVLENPDVVTSDDGFTVTFWVQMDAIDVSIANVSSEPIEVIWQKASIVDTAGNAWDVMRGGGRGALAARDLTGDDISLIPPRAMMHESISPRRMVTYSNGWVRQPFLPIRCGRGRCTIDGDLVGQTVRLNLTLLLRGKERTFDWRFFITKAVKSIRGTRPKDPAFYAPAAVTH